MRRRTITLVVVGLVLALFVLPAAAQVLLDTEPEVTEVTVEQEVPYVSYGYDEDSHTVYMGLEEGDGEPPLDCSIPAEAIVEVDAATEEVTYQVDSEAPVTLPEGCEPVDIEGPNEQLNFGQFVSNMVHALKGYGEDGYNKDNGPFGQWVKQFTHDQEMKDLLKADDDDATVSLDAEADGEKSEKSSKGSENRSDKAKGKNK